MYSSTLNHPIEIQRRIRMGTLPAGDPNLVWQTFAECFASISSRRGREHYDQASRQRVAEVVYHFRMHYEDVEGADETMRVIDENGAIYDIRSILPDADNHDDVILECLLQNGTLGTPALVGYIEDEIFEGNVGEEYVPFSIKASGGASPYTFAISAGSLPAGLELDSATGAVTGTPTAPGSLSVTFAATDAAGTVQTLPPIAITINA